MEKNSPQVPSPTLRGMDELEVMASLQASIDARLLRLHVASEESVRSVVHERAEQLFPGALNEKLNLTPSSMRNRRMGIHSRWLSSKLRVTGGG